VVVPHGVSHHSLISSPVEFHLWRILSIFQQPVPERVDGISRANLLCLPYVRIVYP
jgi:hypothetical protein